MKWFQNRVSQLFSRDKFFYSFCIICIVIIGQLPFVLRALHTPLGHYYPYLDKIFYSEYYYPAIVREGQAGNWLTMHPHVWQSHAPSLVHIVYIWIGKAAALFRLGPFEALALSRVLGGTFLAIAVAVLFRQLLGNSAGKKAFLLFLLAEPSPSMVGSILLQDVGHWVWDYGDAARRLTSIAPHYTIGTALAVLSAYACVRFLKSHSLLAAVVSGAVLFMAGIVYPMPTFMFLFSLGVAGVVTTVFRLMAGKRMNRRELFGLSLIGIMGAMSLVLLRAEAGKGYPWNMWLPGELVFNDPKYQMELTYIQQIGLIGIPVMLSVAVWWKKRGSLVSTMIITWAMSAFLLFPFANVLLLSKYRLIQGGQLPALAIVAYWGWEFWGKRLTLPVLNQLRAVSRGIFAVLFVLTALVFIPMTAYQTTIRLWGYHTNVYLRPNERSALRFLEKNAAPGSIVLSSVYPSNFIPAFAPVRTVIGFPPNYFPREDLFQADLTKAVSVIDGTATTPEARTVLSGWNIRYVYVEAVTETQHALYPDLLRKRYDAENFVIYEVISSRGASS